MLFPDGRIVAHRQWACPTLLHTVRTRGVRIESVLGKGKAGKLAAG